MLAGLGGMLGSDSCSGSPNSSDEKLFRCNSSSDTIFFDVEPYFGDIDFHIPRDQSPTRFAFPPVSRLTKPDTLSEKYITRAAQLVSNLSYTKKQAEEVKEDEVKKKQNGDFEEFILFEKEEKKDNDDCPKMRRASSLKSPGSPPPAGAKKIVRFADVLGLDLADVRTFLDEIPKVPKSAYKDLEGVEVASSPPIGFNFRESSSTLKNEKSVVPLFQQPFMAADFADRLRKGNVCLESASVTDPLLFMITGIVRVINLGFHKTVTVRYSLDGWKSHNDLAARYVPNSCDGFSDKFSFSLYANSLEVGKRLEFALKYDVNNSTFWDNNNSANYTFQCVPAGSPRPIVSAYSNLSFQTCTFY